MPKKIDEAEVLVAYAELQNGRAVSRRTGVHENTVYQILRRHHGECVRCKAPVAPGKKQCSRCLAWERDRARRRRQERIRHGLCVQCGQQRSHISRLYCDAHRLLHVEHCEKSRVKRKSELRGSPHGQASNLRQRLRRIREEYGQNGVTCWQNADATCEICRAKYGDVAIHIHHIDEDHSNSELSNYACLCFDCHKAIHYLLSSKNRRGLVGWFRRTYPDKPL
jgi:hypothetical protein